MPATQFTLIAVTSRDGFITGPQGEPPYVWASPEEQLCFAEMVSALDWAFLGRLTHTTAWRADRRRVVFSRSFGAGEWRHPRHLWVDPARVPLGAILDTVRPVHPHARCGILGGVAVHGWFADQALIDAAAISIEPFDFGAGLSLFPESAPADPRRTLEELGLVQTEEFALNAQGTLLCRFVRREAAGGRADRHDAAQP